jgi:glycosyltransferase involved in cell wall biosynthesis
MIKNLVSIIIPYYNSENYLKRLLDSIKNQRYRNFECILVDDGSTDDSFDLINNLVAEDNRFLNVKRPSTHKHGGRGSKNFGFENCKGSLIVFFDADDEMENTFLSSRVEFLCTNLECNAVISNYYYRYSETSTKRNTLIYNSYIFEDFSNIVINQDFWLHYSNYMFYYNPGNAMYRRDIILNSELWNENTSIGEDYEYHSRLILKGMNLGFINSVTFNYMLNDSSMIATSDAIKPLVSRSFGRMLVLDNLLNHFGSINNYLRTEFNWQLRIMRRIVFCNDNSEMKKYAIHLLKIRLIYILELLEIKEKKKISIILIINILTLIMLKFAYGYRVFDFLLFKEDFRCSYGRYMTFLKFDKI